MENDVIISRTLSVSIKNEQSKLILKHMASISKNVYNTYIYIGTIYNRYKNEIFKNVRDNYEKFESSDDIMKFITQQMNFFYKLHSSSDSVINENTKIIYLKLIDRLNGKKLVNSNYNKTTKQENILLEIVK